MALRLPERAPRLEGSWRWRVGANSAPWGRELATPYSRRCSPSPGCGSQERGQIRLKNGSLVRNLPSLLMLILTSIALVLSSLADGAVSTVNDGLTPHAHLPSVKVDIANGPVVDGWINCICKII